jgi:TM2 domain-containing membrane protein YozV
MFCSACGKENAPDGRFCSGCGGSLAAPAAQAQAQSCPRCGAGLSLTARSCPRCGFPLELPEERSGAVPPPLPAAAPAARRSPVPAAGNQSPLLALVLGLLLPGAGQAYNGQPIKGFFLFFTSILAIPYLFSLYDAYATAARIRAAGMSSGCAGFFWVFLQVWLAANTALLVVIVLTFMGVFT